MKTPPAAKVWLGLQPTQLPVWPRRVLAPGIVFRGPALILEEMATFLVLPEFNGWVDDRGHIHLQVPNGAAPGTLPSSPVGHNFDPGLLPRQ